MPYNSKQISELQSHRDADPHSRGYSGMSDSQFLASVNLADISQPRQTNSVEVFNALVGSDLPARSGDKWQNLMLLATMNSGGSFYLEGNILLVLTDIFGPGTDTRANLIALSTEDKSPAQIAGLPAPTIGDVVRTT